MNFQKKQFFEVKKVWKGITKGAKLTYDHVECQLKLTLVIHSRYWHKVKKDLCEGYKIVALHVQISGLS